MPWCPNCKTEYQDGYTVCSDCGSTLVESLEQAAAEEAAEYIRDAAASFPDDTGFETEEIQEAQEETLPECLEVTAVADDGEIMAVQHKEYAVYGLQFHPESIMTPEGRTILANFLQLCK